MNPLNSGVSDPLTPEQSKAQVVDAAKEIVEELGLDVVSAIFWHSSCNDQGEPPFRGRVKIFYPNAGSFEESDREVEQMLQRLQTIGWEPDPDHHTHGSSLRKNEVVVDFGPQTASSSNRNIQLLGECRDITTPKGHHPSEDLDLS